MKIILVLIAFASTLMVKAQTTNDVWINEFHYDGMTSYGQSDINEFVELIIKAPIAENPVELAKYSLVLFTVGALDNNLLTPGRGLPYNVSSPLYTAAETVYPLSGFQQCTTGIPGYTILSKPMSIMQDIPAAMAIIYNNTTVVQLISYEKAFRIAPAGGAAAGLTTLLISNSLNMPAVENALSQTNHAVSLIGTGINYSQFTWDDLITRTATPCALNTGQTLQVPLPVQWIDFKAVAIKDIIYLQWKTGDELTNLRYEIELFKNSSFEKVASVKKDLTFKGIYNHELSQMADGVYRIRIKSVEVDGSYNYSSEQLVTIGKKAAGISVYPNPATNKSAVLRVVPMQQNGYVITITDATGRRMLVQKTGPLQANKLNLVPLQFKHLYPGTYRVQISNINERYNTTLVIIE